MSLRFPADPKGASALNEAVGAELMRANLGPLRDRWSGSASDGKYANSAKKAQYKNYYFLVKYSYMRLSGITGAGMQGVNLSPPGTADENFLL